MSSRSKRSPILHLLALTVLVVFVACVQGIRAPEVAPQGTLGLSDGHGAEEDVGPLAVVFSSPTGRLRGPSEITVLFNKPLRALEMAGAELPFPATVSPGLAGTWQWTGTRAASFIPSRADGGGAARLPAATLYTVRIPRGTRALDGDTLAEDFTFSFETERPEVESASPYQGSDNLRPDATFSLSFNQPMDLAEVQRTTSLLVAQKPWQISVTPSSPGDERSFTIRPAGKLPLDSDLKLQTAADLRGKDGPLTALSAQSFAYRTLGPLVVREIRCYKGAPGDKCAAGSGVSVIFSNPVRAKDAKRVISIEPAVPLRFPSWISDDDTLQSVQIDVGFRPGQSYSINVAAGLTDVLGQRMAVGSSRRIAFGDLWPVARIGFSSGVIEASSKRDFSIAHINASDLEIDTLPLDEQGIFTFESDRFDAAAAAKLPGLVTQKVKEGRRNVRELQQQPISKILGSEKARGPFAVLVRYTSNGKPQIERSVGQLTDLAISAKVSKKGSLVWVSRISNGAPLKEAEVLIKRKGQVGAQKLSDKTGMASFSAQDFVPSFDNEEAIIFVKTADDSAYLPVSDTIYTDFDSGNDETIGMLFSDRRIYRPGDTAHLKGILRQPTATGSRPPVAGLPVSVVVEGPDGEKLQTLSSVTNVFGTYSVDVKLPASARLGTHWITTKVGNENAGSDELEVAEYRPAEFKAAVESDRPSYLRGQTASWVARGDYLYGAPMVGSSADLAVMRSETYFTPKGLAEFQTDDRPYYEDLDTSVSRAGQIFSTQAKLDAKGAASATASLALVGMRGPETVTCYVDVRDISRQVISTSTTAMVHPAAHYVGLKLDDWFVPQGSKIVPQVLAAKPDGERVVGAPLKLSLIKREWAVAKQQSGVGTATTVTSLVDKVVASCDKRSEKSPVSCEFSPTDAGYYIVRVESSDEAKNPVAASQEVYVSGTSASPFASFYESDQGRVELVRDKSNYKIGDVARILVKSPWKQSEALLTIERDGVLEQRRVALSGSAPTLQIPITEAMRPNAFVSVLVLRGRTQPAPARSDKPDLGAPTYRVGYTQLLLDPEDKRLSVALVPSKTDLRPGEEIKVDLAVTDRQGRAKQAELTVYAVDEGVLSLVGYKTPDPIPIFGAPRPLRVATLESRSNLTRFFDPLSGVGLDKGDNGGGGGEGAPQATRRDFRPAAYFNPSVVTDAQGKATVSFKLPDSLTAYRLMAVAVSREDHFGRGETQITTSRPLMARPALPRFLRAGDRFEASVIVSSKGAAGEVLVKAEFEGVKLLGDAEKRVNIGAGESVEVRYAVDAPSPANARFGFSVQGVSASDRVMVERKVAVPLPPEVVALYGSTAQASAEKLGDFSAMRSDVGELTVTTASTALVGLDVGGNQLLDYPYGCTEQLTSRLVPLVAVRDLAADFSLELPKNLDDVVEKTVAKLLTHQRHDGSFGFWPDSPEASSVATAYAVWGLSQVKKRGYKVPQTAIDSGTRALRALLERKDERLAMGPFALYVLAELGSPDAGRAATLFAEREAMPAYSKAFLLSAFVLGKGDQGSIDTLVKELESLVRLDGPVARIVESQGDSYRGYLDSEARTMALTLRALLMARPSHPLGKELAMALLRTRKGGAWRSTQETAWALLALGDYRRAQEKVDPAMTARVFLGSSLIAEHEFFGRSLKPEQDVVPAADLRSAFGQPLAFSVEGQGSLFYEARLRYVRKELPKDTIDRGFYVEKRMRRVTADTMAEALGVVPTTDLRQFSGGDLVLVDVVVVTPKPRSFVVVDDPLPAGFEAVDMRLSTSSGRLGMSDYADDEDTADYGGNYFTKEVRDDRVLFFVDDMAAGVYRYRYLARATAFGSFVVPPTRAEEMYAPEVFGRTAAGIMQITPTSR